MVEAYVPKTLDECLELLNEKKLKIVAGGTDMLIQNRSHTGMSIGYKMPVIYVKNLSELNKIYEDDEFIYIGSCVSLEKIIEEKKKGDLPDRKGKPFNHEKNHKRDKNLTPGPGQESKQIKKPVLFPENHLPQLYRHFPG